MNNGTLAYVAQGADGTYALAFRGTDVDGSIPTAFWNVLEDADGFPLVPWVYGQHPDAQITAGINAALALAIGMADPVTNVSLLDYLRGLAKSGPLDLMVTGHSLGAALVVVATAWLNDQLAKIEQLKFSLSPYTFAAPTMWNGPFATMFRGTFSSYYAAVNTNDVVPMGWADLNSALDTYVPPGPLLLFSDFILYGLMDYTQALIERYQYDYTEIIPIGSNPNGFTQFLTNTDSWTEEAAAMHSMQFVYFPHATGTTAPILPNTTRTGRARPRRVSPA